MSRSTVIVIALWTLMLFAPAVSADPETVDECLSATFDVAEKASQKKLSETTARTVESLMARLEGECSSQKLSEAGNTIIELKALIEQN